MALENTPNWPWMILGMAFLLAIAIAGYVAQRQKPTSGLNASKMKFVWNEATSALESDDPTIFILVLGESSGRTDEQYVLHLNEKKFGFTTKYPAGRTVNNRRVWVVNALCVTIYRGGRQGETYASSIKFSDEAEQSLAIDFIRSALSSFRDISHNNINVKSDVIIDNALQARIDRGDFIISAIKK